MHQGLDGLNSMRIINSAGTRGGHVDNISLSGIAKGLGRGLVIDKKRSQFLLRARQHVESWGRLRIGEWMIGTGDVLPGDLSRAQSEDRVGGGFRGSDLRLGQQYFGLIKGRSIQLPLRHFQSPLRIASEGSAASQNQREDQAANGMGNRHGQLSRGDGVFGNHQLMLENRGALLSYLQLTRSFLSSDQQLRFLLDVQRLSPFDISRQRLGLLHFPDGGPAGNGFPTAAGIDGLVRGSRYPAGDRWRGAHFGMTNALVELVKCHAEGVHGFAQDSRNSPSRCCQNCGDDDDLSPSQSTEDRVKAFCRQIQLKVELCIVPSGLRINLRPVAEGGFAKVERRAGSVNVPAAKIAQGPFAQARQAMEFLDRIPRLEKLILSNMTRPRGRHVGQRFPENV